MPADVRSLYIPTVSMIAVSAILIVIGLIAPAFTIDTLASRATDVSILVGAWNSLLGKDRWIGSIVILFSAVFPCVKLFGLVRIVGYRHPGDARAVLWLELLGKWSMLADFTPLAGLWLLIAAALVTTASGILLRARLVQAGVE